MSMEVTTGTERSTTSEVEKLLGIQVHLKWGNYILTSKKSLVKALTTRSNALAMIGRLTDFATRQRIANGIFQSYCLAVFGGTEDYLLRALQRIQTRAASMVSRRGRHYPAAAALKEFGWLPMASFVEYYTKVQAKKVLETQKPTYLYRKLVGSRTRPAYATRLCIGGNL